MTCQIRDLPDDVLFEIFQIVQFRDLIQLSSTNTRFFFLINSDLFWKKKLHLKLGEHRLLDSSISYKTQFLNLTLLVTKRIPVTCIPVNWFPRITGIRGNPIYGDIQLDPFKSTLGTVVSSIFQILTDNLFNTKCFLICLYKHDVHMASLYCKGLTIDDLSNLKLGLRYYKNIWSLIDRIEIQDFNGFLIRTYAQAYSTFTNVYSDVTDQILNEKLFNVLDLLS